jgi:uncharacterized protein YukE
MANIASGRSGANNSVSHPGMMGDGTEEQNLNQRGNPSARITEDEVNAAFGGAEGAALGGQTAAVKAGAKAVAAKASRAASQVASEAREFAGKADAYYDEAIEEAEEQLSSLADKVAALRDQVAQSADAARAWAGRKADAALQTAQDKPVLVVSASAGIALAVGLMAGFVIGRATADEF